MINFRRIQHWSLGTTRRRNSEVSPTLPSLLLPVKNINLSKSSASRKLLLHQKLGMKNNPSTTQVSSTIKGIAELKRVAFGFKGADPSLHSISCYLNQATNAFERGWLRKRQLLQQNKELTSLGKQLDDTEINELFDMTFIISGLQKKPEFALIDYLS